MKMIFSVLLVIAILYIIRVPQVVLFVNNVSQPVFSVTNYIVDVVTHIRERHPFMYMALFFALFFLMRPQYEG